MNILIVLNRSDNKSNFLIKHQTLLKYTESWSKEGNSIYIISNITDVSYKSLDIRFVTPPDYLFTHLLVSAWFLLVNHITFDYVIEETAVTPFIQTKSEKVMYISGLPQKDDFFSAKKYMEKIILVFIRYFYKTSFFLVSSWDWFKLLTSVGIKEKKIFLLKEGLDVSTQKMTKGNIAKKILFIETEDYHEVESASEVFSLVERKDLGWEFTLMVRNNLIDKVKTMLREKIQSSAFRVVGYDSAQRFVQEIKRTGMVLNVRLNENSLKNDVLALSYQKPVVTGESEFLDRQGEIIKYLFISPEGDFSAMASTALELVNNTDKYQKKITAAREFTKNYSWRNLSIECLEFLVTVRH